MLLINGDTRQILVPKEDAIFGVTSDEKTNIKYFKGPRYTKNGIDLAAASIRINYINAGSETNQYIVTDLEADDENIIFSWTLHRSVTIFRGTVYFIVCAVITDENGNITNEWNTTSASGTVLQGIEVDGSAYEEEVADAIESILLAAQKRIDSMVVDDTLTQQGVAADSKTVGDRFSQLSEEMEEFDSGSLNATASALLINILRNAMYTADQSANITALEAALAMSGSSGDGGDSGGSEGDGGETVTTYSIVSALLHATSNNAAASVESGASYTATITADDGYNLDGATVSVSMGGVDITATAYSDGVVNIASVTGNVIITVNAVSIAVSEILYELAEPTTFDGTNSIDTGVALLANDISWSIVGELENLVDGQPIRFFEIGTDKMNEYKFKMEVAASNAHSIRWSDKTVTCAKLIWLGQKAGNTAKFVITHEAGTNTIKYYGYHTNIAGKTERFDSELVRDNYVALEDTLSICTAGSFRMDTFGIYSRVYTADEITAYLGA